MNEKFLKKLLEDVEEDLKNLPGAGKILNRYILCHIQCGDGKEYYCRGFQLEDIEEILDFIKKYPNPIIKISLSELGSEKRRVYRNK